MKNSNTIRSLGVLSFGFVLIVVALNLSGVQGLANRSLIRLDMGVRSLGMNRMTETSAVELLEQRVRIESLELENKRLRDLLGFFQKTDFQAVVANVISRDPLDPSIIYVDQGSRSGLVLGQPVIAADGVLIGKVSQVTPHKAIIELAVNDASRIATKILGNTGTGGILKGYGGKKMQMELVIDSDSITPGAIVVSSGLETLVPENLLIGVIGNVEKTQGELFTHSDVQSAVDLNSIRIVSILLTT